MKETNKIQTALITAVQEAFEAMAFEEVRNLTESEFSEEEVLISDQDEEHLEVSLKASHPLTGKIKVVMHFNSTRTLTQGIYGIESNDVTEEMIHDSLSEIVNTLTGCFMRELFSDGSEYTLGLPELGYMKLPEFVSEVLTEHFMVGDELLTVKLWMEKNELNTKAQSHKGFS
ncbi:MAG: hypothetical protein HQ568_08680 [Calditrichaeota bacterium]|nr:hypothetical protein [Calditrichota bacterium]